MITQENKNLLLKDLCARLPYGVKLQVSNWDSDHGFAFDTVETLIGIDNKFIYTVWDKTGDKEKHAIVEPLSVLDYPMYLRPMSSMTEEEKEELEDKQIYISDYAGMLTEATVEGFDWLNAHHFDYRGLIEKGLALEAPEGLYKTE